MVFVETLMAILITMDGRKEEFKYNHRKYPSARSGRIFSDYGYILMQWSSTLSSMHILMYRGTSYKVFYNEMGNSYLVGNADTAGQNGYVVLRLVLTYCNYGFTI